MRTMRFGLVLALALTVAACGDDTGAVDAGVAMDAGPGDGSGIMDARPDTEDAMTDGSVAGPDGGACTPATCMSAGAECGMLSDGCDGVLDCGTCMEAGETCGGGGMANRCGEGMCAPTTCASAGAECGMVSDGCGGVLSCGGCTAPETCGGGGVANQCGGGMMMGICLLYTSPSPRD